MGYHSDQTDILENGTGIAIVSLGETRSLTFRNIADPAEFHAYELPSGSLIYMTQEVQANWQHAIPKSDTYRGRTQSPPAPRGAGLLPLSASASKLASLLKCKNPRR
jgi:alkylated DNA repair dioxygenase AlkB